MVSDENDPIVAAIDTGDPYNVMYVEYHGWLAVNANDDNVLCSISAQFYIPELCQFLKEKVEGFSDYQICFLADFGCLFIHRSEVDSIPDIVNAVRL